MCPMRESLIALNLALEGQIIARENDTRAREAQMQDHTPEPSSNAATSKRKASNKV